MVNNDTLVIANARAVTPQGDIENATIRIEQGRIAGFGRATVQDNDADLLIDAGGNLVLPGFIDVHVHGGNGCDVMDGTVEAVHALAVHLARHGVTGFLATTVTACQDETVAVADIVRQARLLPSPGATVLGMHIEGPYINPQRRGAQNPECIRAPSITEIDAVIAASGDSVRLVTLAPELPGAHAFIAHLRRRGVVASMGHSDASYEQALAALDAGVTHVTHLYNAMRPFQHRDPGLIGVVLSDERAMVELIADGVHVHPGAARLLIQARGTAGVVLVSDAMRGCGLPFGCYLMNGQEVRTSEEGAHTSEGRLAGSLLTLETALQHVIEWTGLSLRLALAMTSLNQARELALQERKGSIAVGKDADLIICTSDLQVQATLVGGRIVYRQGI